MQCPSCQNPNSRVLESRSTEAGKTIRRRRECLECKQRFTTYERIEFVPLIVIKKNGKRESFDRSKILRGMVRACEKTNILTSRLEAIASEIESLIEQLPNREITTKEIGALVLRYLRQENQVAYIRFASVYGQFQNFNDFLNLLLQLQENNQLPSLETSEKEKIENYSLTAGS